jgi:hypothetical protein
MPPRRRARADLRALRRPRAPGLSVLGLAASTCGGLLKESRSTSVAALHHHRRDRVRYGEAPRVSPARSSSSSASRRTMALLAAADLLPERAGVRSSRASSPGARHLPPGTEFARLQRRAAPWCTRPRRTRYRRRRLGSGRVPRVRRGIRPAGLAGHSLNIAAVGACAPRALRGSAVFG